ncbi:glycosyltransferase family 2 protein [Fimbriiglobus ruber]|uniref:Glycosyltransferase n=1 Tax=Fimbriiglobus ruber TaxID=1908690 RepID=A0A225DYF4_9BACT|nr:glycosyltransferase family 2 protein [Fimbriiglobus ruber]OWK43568.1 Glycosyltransferase [Fimbriiglobus ruber]
MPSVSVIVPVRNEARSIEQTLRSLLTQDYPVGQFDVIVADGVSTDATVPIVRRLQGEFPNLKLVFNPARFSSAGRNAALRHATGEYVVVVDGHCHVPDRNYLKNLADAFETSGADCLGRPQPLDVPDPTPFQAAVSVARSSRLGHNPESDIFSDEAKFVPPQSTAVAYRRSVFHKVGMFDEAFDACEDVEFNHRVHAAGLTCYFTPTLKIVYHPRSGLPALFRQLGRYGCGRARLAAKHASSLSLPALVPPVWAVWLVVGAVAAVMVPVVAWVYLASVVLYLAVILAGAAWLGRRQPARVAVRVPVVFVGIHLGFAWGFLREVGRRVARR